MKDKYNGQTELDALWHKHIGSRRIFTNSELTTLRKLKKSKVLPWDQVYLLYLTSKHWRMLREKILKRDGNKCVQCSSDDTLQVDHIRYGVMGKEKPEDLQTLCLECHSKKTNSFVLGESISGDSE